MMRKLSFFPGVGLILAGCFGAWSVTSEAASVVPFWGIAVEGVEITEERLLQVEKETGLAPQIVLFFLQWPADPDRISNRDEIAAFPLSSVEAIWRRGAIPCVTWEPMYYDPSGNEQMVGYQGILRGLYDPYLTAFARQAGRWGKPLMIRFAHEMNLSRYHWGTDARAFGAKSPEIYRKMYRYVVSVFKREGATNVLWVFCPNAESIPNPRHDKTASWNDVRRYYPGDQWVDVLGMDGYNWGTTQTKENHGWDSSWRSFAGIFQPLYEELKILSPGKPLFVFETSTVGSGGDKAQWIREAFETVRRWKIQGLVWFQVKKELDWLLQSEGDNAHISVIRSATSSVQDWAQGLKMSATPRKESLKGP